MWMEIMRKSKSENNRNDKKRLKGSDEVIKDIPMNQDMKTRLQQTDKLASLGQLAGGVAHEINNPLGIILGYTQLILKDVAKGCQIYDDLKVIEKHAMNCKTIVEDLLKFSRTMDTQKTRSDINELVHEAVSVVRVNFEKDHIEVQEELASELPDISVDPEKMRQVFMNLLINGRQAIERSGYIKVCTDKAPDGKHIVISFADSGCGITQDIIQRIFDPFFTTKSTGIGTGLGLSVSYGIVRDHAGDICVESTPGRGAVFTIYLPVGEAG